MKGKHCYGLWQLQYTLMWTERAFFSWYKERNDVKQRKSRVEPSDGRRHLPWKHVHSTSKPICTKTSMPTLQVSVLRVLDLWWPRCWVLVPEKEGETQSSPLQKCTNLFSSITKWRAAGRYQKVRHTIFLNRNQRGSGLSWLQHPFSDLLFTYRLRVSTLVLPTSGSDHSLL